MKKNSLAVYVQCAVCGNNYKVVFQPGAKFPETVATIRKHHRKVGTEYPFGRFSISREVCPGSFSIYNKELTTMDETPEQIEEKRQTFLEANNMTIADLDTYVNFLDNLREGGTINMYGAPPVLARRFGLSNKVANAVWIFWTETFEHFHPNG